jgi:hypothetical protein
MSKRNCVPIYAFVIASLIVSVVAMTNCALAAEMPKDFQGIWCTNLDTLKDMLAHDPDMLGPDGAACEGYKTLEITATEVKSPDLSMSCIVRKVTKFDVCPWGMIFRNRERARVLRPGQINPWTPGYHIVFQCTDGRKRPRTIETDWVIEKGSIRGEPALPREYRCPWAR